MCTNCYGRKSLRWWTTTNTDNILKWTLQSMGHIWCVGWKTDQPTKKSRFISELLTRKSYKHDLNTKFVFKCVYISRPLQLCFLMHEPHLSFLYLSNELIYGVCGTGTRNSLHSVTLPSNWAKIFQYFTINPNTERGKIT